MDNSPLNCMRCQHAHLTGYEWEPLLLSLSCPALGRMDHKCNELAEHLCLLKVCYQAGIQGFAFLLHDNTSQALIY